MMKDSLLEISSLGMREWFRQNLSFTMEEYRFTAKCGLDNPIKGFGYTAVYDPKFKRILLTKRELIPTKKFIDGWNANTITLPCQSYPDGAIRYFPDICEYKKWGALKGGGCGWTDIPLTCAGIGAPYFDCGGWTISYYPEIGVWGSFHDYVPYIFFKTSTDFYSLTDKYERPVWTAGTSIAYHAGTSFGNAGIWKHNDKIVHGIYYQEHMAVGGNIGYTDWLEQVVDHHLFEFEFIHNEYKAEDILTSSINYTLETFNQENISVLENGFTSFFIYNTFQMSGENVLEYLVNVRRVGNNWKINKFRDMAALATNTNAYYMSTNTNVTGGINVGTSTTSAVNNMFISSGMDKTINPIYLDLTKNWNLQRKFIDKWVGIRLIYNNISNNSLNLYATGIGVRKTYR